VLDQALLKGVDSQDDVDCRTSPRYFWLDTYNSTAAFTRMQRVFSRGSATDSSQMVNEVVILNPERRLRMGLAAPALR
jgi:hypothetical protein